MDKLIHEPARLRIMAHLFKARDASFVALRDATGLSDGNFASHVSRLEAASYVTIRKILSGARFEQRYQITKKGHEAFIVYLADLERTLYGK